MKVKQVNMAVNVINEGEKMIKERNEKDELRKELSCQGREGSGEK